jgi:hypothetical protein
VIVRTWNTIVSVVASAIVISVSAQSPGDPVVAFAIGTTLTLSTSTGKVVREIHLKRPVLDFAFSKDRKFLVTVAPDTEHGGALTLVDLQTRVQKQFTSGHLYFKHLQKTETEVYDSPRFSPDGRSIAFAIHGNLPGDGNDALENSGPIAIFDFATGKTHLLKSTENIDGQGPCSESSPIWSPDGKWILFNCEAGAFITDLSGTTLRAIKVASGERFDGYVVSWVGKNCLLYSQSIDAPPNAPPTNDQSKLLNLRTLESQPLATLLTFPLDTVKGLEELSESAAIRRIPSGSGSSLFVETKGADWRFPSPVSAHVLSGWSYAHVPKGCD